MMKKRRYILALQLVLCVLLISSLLQNCSNTTNLPIQLEGGLRKRARIEAVDQAETRLGLIGVGEEQQEIEKEKRNVLTAVHLELWQEILSYLSFEDVLSARLVNTIFNELITGTKQIGLVGAENRLNPYNNTAGWTINWSIDFRKEQVTCMLQMEKLRYIFFFFS